jgi:hypothetical protein
MALTGGFCIITNNVFFPNPEACINPISKVVTRMDAVKLVIARKVKKPIWHFPQIVCESAGQFLLQTIDGYIYFLHG